MRFPNWGRLFEALAKAAHDEKANAPRPAAASMTAEEALAALDRLETALPAIQAWLAAHPGALTAADDLLEVLEAEGVSWASGVRAGVDAAPSALATAGTALHVIGGLLKATGSAPVGIPGGWSGARGHVL